MGLILQPIGTLLYTYYGHTGWIYAVVWLPTKSLDPRIASAGNDKTVQIWDAMTGLYPVKYREHTARVNSIAWSCDGHYLASASADRTVRVHEVAFSREISCFSLHKKPVKTVVWSPKDSRFLASGGSDTVVRIWKLSGTLESSFQNHEKKIGSSGINAVAWSPDGTLIASAGEDQTVRVWEVFTSKEILRYKEHRRRISTIAWSPDSRLIASAGDDKAVHIWEAGTGNQVRAPITSERYSKAGIRKPLYFDSVTAVSWSPDGKKLALASQRVVHIFNNTQRRIEHLYSYQDHTDWVRTVAWSPDSNYIASAGDDSCVRVWSAAVPYIGPASGPNP